MVPSIPNTIVTNPLPTQITINTNMDFTAGIVRFNFPIHPTPSSNIVHLPTYGLDPPIGIPSTVTVNLNSNRLIMNFELEYSID
jgi:hypothetical protein